MGSFFMILMAVLFFPEDREAAFYLKVESAAFEGMD
jgi:hypothetical protein